MRFARKEGITDEALLKAVAAADIKPDADLGGGVIKQRVARQGQGKSGGFRTIIVYRRGALAFFVFGFPKSDRGNISMVEERAFKKLADVLLAVTGEQILAMIQSGEIAEVLGNDE
jgi:hypothetical protein